MNTQQISQQNDYTGLTFVCKFGLLRAQELGLLMWPNTARSGYPQACRIVKSWLSRALIIERTLPECHGRAFVLSKKGAAFLKKLEQELIAQGIETNFEPGIIHRSGKDIGHTTDGVWTPPAAWKHDLISHGVLARLATLGWTIYPENQIRAADDWAGKIPDSLAKRDANVLWIETECAAKDGRQKQKPLGTALALASENRLPAVLGMRSTLAAVAFDVDALDSRGYQLDHKARVTTAIQKQIKQDVIVMWIECRTENFGVVSMTQAAEFVRAAPGQRVLQIMNASGWNRVPGSLCAWQVQYGQHRAEVGEAREQKTFYHQIDGGTRFGAPTLTAAKQSAGNAVAVLRAVK